MTNLYLNDEEQAMLNGAFGPGVQRAMEIVATLGRIYGAPDLAPITHAQIAGVSYKNIGDAGVAFLSAWAAEGARVRVPTMLNPMGMEEARWQEMGVAEAFAKPQLEAIGAFSKLGVQQTLTCVPYLLPEAGLQRGDHVAWAESSAVAFGSSILALRTNREGGPSALAAAIVGRTARYGYHLDQGRQAIWVIEVACPVRSIADFGALGYLVGKEVGNGCLWFSDLGAWLPPLPADVTAGGAAGDRLKTLGAALAGYGAVALYHIAGYTPEAAALGETLIRPDARRLRVESLAPAYAVMDANPEVSTIDLVTIGCPHASLSEIQAVAQAVRGQKLATQLWVTTGRSIRQHAEVAGWVHDIEAAGGLVVADTCAVVAPIKQLGIKSMATNAGKMACYAPAHSGVTMRFGELEQCIEAALSGLWPAAL